MPLLLYLFKKYTQDFRINVPWWVLYLLCVYSLMEKAAVSILLL